VNEAAEAFRSAAERYCVLIEEADAADREVYDAILERLAALYATAHRLARVGPATDDDLPDRPTIEEQAALERRLSGLFEPRDVYWLIEPYEARPEKNILAGTLSEDLASVWRDVKQGLLALEAGVPEDDVLWDWWFGLDAHWGRHAVDAIAALHKLRSA
jgi:hypothetical protein